MADYTIDAATSGAQIVDEYDSQLDELMQAISAYVNLYNERVDGLQYYVLNQDTGVYFGCGSAQDAQNLIDQYGWENGVVLTRNDDDSGNYTGSDGKQYFKYVDNQHGFSSQPGDKYSWAPLSVDVNGQTINAANVDRPGFQLTAATITNDITTNIGFTGKVVADKNKWVTMISQAVR